MIRFVSILSFIFQTARKKNSASFSLKLDRIAHTSKTPGSVFSRFRHRYFYGSSSRTSPGVVVIVFLLVHCATGCISLSDQGLTILFSPRAEQQTTAAASDETLDSNKDPESSKNSRADGSSTIESDTSLPPQYKALERKLNNDHWRSVSIWPEPIDGVEKVRSLRSQPLFRWQHQELDELPAQSTQKQAENDSSENKTEEDSPENDQLVPQTDQHKQLQPHLVARLRQIADQDRLSGWNAVILLARQAPKKLTPDHWNRLEELSLKNISYNAETGVREKGKAKEKESGETSSEKIKSISEAMQAAAAESWCYALSKRPGSAPENFKKAGLALQGDALSDAVRLELMRGIARKIKPRLIPTLNDHLAESELQQVKVSSLTLAVLDACICYAVHHPRELNENRIAELQSVITVNPESLDPQKLWPENIWDLRWHQDNQVVNRFGMWLALTKHPIAQSYLTRRLHHLEHSVQYHALRNLGLLGSETALEKLRNIAETRPGISRAVALMAIGDRDRELIYRFRDDEAAVVRLAIARFAGQHLSSESAKILQELAHDEDLKIQQAALEAVAEWPDDKAFPVLSSAFVSGGVSTRNNARKRLEQRFDLVMTAVQDEKSDREEILKTISRDFQLVQHANSDLFQHSKPQQKDEKEQREQIRDILNQLAQEDKSSRKKERLSKEIVPLFERAPNAFDEVLNEQGIKQLEQILEELSSFGISEAEKMIRLNSEQLQHRRRAAQYFAEQAKTKTLATWKLRLIAERLEQEQDLHVCRDLMMTIEQDTTQEARVVAQNGLTHTWPDVRILGCQYVQKQRVPQLAPFLLPLLHERNASVQRAAILACGYCRNPLVIDGFQESQNSRQGGLRSLLGTVNRETELLVIAGLARLVDEQGRNELLKLSYSADTNTRRQVVQIMGELQDQRLIEHLIRIGWTEPAADVRLAVLDALKKTVPRDQQPKILASDSTEQQMQIWSEWLDKNANNF